MENRGVRVHARALQRAAAILGGKHKLREVLHVPMGRLDQWLDGKDDPPMDVFLRAVDVISAPPNGHLLATPAAAPARIQVPQGAPTLSEPVARFLGAAFGPRDRGAMLQSALSAAIDATHAQRGNVQLKTDDALCIVAHYGFDQPFLKFFARVAHGHGAACGAALQRGARVIVSDVATDPIFSGTEAARVMEEAGARAVQSTPLVSASGELLGMLSTHFERPHRPAEGDLALVDEIAERAAFWLERATA